MTPAEKLLEARNLEVVAEDASDSSATAGGGAKTDEPESEEDRIKRIKEENSRNNKYRINVKSIVVIVKRIIYSDKIYSHHQKLLAGGKKVSLLNMEAGTNR